MNQVQFIASTIPGEFTQGKIYDTHTKYQDKHLAVIDDAGDEHLIASIHNEQGQFASDKSLNERFVWGEHILRPEYAQTQAPERRAYA